MGDTALQVVLWGVQSSDWLAMSGLDRSVFEKPMNVMEIAKLHRDANVFSVMATTDVEGHCLVGYLTYVRKRRSIQVIRVAVDPGCQRQGVATALIRKVERLYPNRDRVIVDVPEDELACQLWLRSCGYHARIVNRPKSTFYRFSYYLACSLSS